MKVISTKIEGLLLIEELSLDDVESFPLQGMELSQWRYSGEDGVALFTRAKLEYGNIRGLHFQRGQYAQTRFVRVLGGKIFDVVLDMRKDSKTFGQHVRVELKEDDGRGILIPSGCAHGFSVISSEAEVGIWWDKKFRSDFCGSVFALDKNLGIDWGVPPSKRIILPCDKKAPQFRRLFFSGRKAKSGLNLQ